MPKPKLGTGASRAKGKSYTEWDAMQLAIETLATQVRALQRDVKRLTCRIEADSQ